MSITIEGDSNVTHTEIKRNDINNNITVTIDDGDSNTIHTEVQDGSTNTIDVQIHGQSNNINRATTVNNNIKHGKVNMKVVQ